MLHKRYTHCVWLFSSTWPRAIQRTSESPLQTSPQAPLEDLSAPLPQVGLGLPGQADQEDLLRAVISHHDLRLSGHSHFLSLSHAHSHNLGSSVSTLQWLGIKAVSPDWTLLRRSSEDQLPLLLDQLNVFCPFPWAMCCQSPAAPGNLFLS